MDPNPSRARPIATALHGPLGSQDTAGNVIEHFFSKGTGADPLADIGAGQIQRTGQQPGEHHGFPEAIHVGWFWRKMPFPSVHKPF